MWHDVTYLPLLTHAPPSLAAKKIEIHRAFLCYLNWLLLCQSHNCSLCRFHCSALSWCLVLSCPFHIVVVPSLLETLTGLCALFLFSPFFCMGCFQWKILVQLSNPIMAVPVQSPAPVQALWSQLWPHLFSSLWWRCLFCLSCRRVSDVESGSLSIIWLFMDLTVTFFKVAWNLDCLPAPGAQTLCHLSDSVV